jgi:GntR family transcriptional repressor for pyruvate dehydrogenase complex
MRSLENAGLITVRAGSGGGAFVKKISSDNLSETFEGIVKLDKVSMEDLTEARLAIQNRMIPMIIDSIRPEHIEALEKHIAKASENLQKGIHESMNMEFHMLLASSCRNQLLLKIDEALLRVMARMASTYEYSYQRKKKALEGHREIVELLKAGKYEDFARILKEHIKGASEFFVSQD